jgi:hypothetical protein
MAKTRTAAVSLAARFIKEEFRALAGPLQGPERRNRTGVGRHIRSSGGRAVSSGSPRRTRRRTPVDRLDSKQLTFNQWADWFLERRSKPPFRSAGNHQVNSNALKFLRPVFGELALSEITAEAVENYLADRLQSGRRIHTKFGLQLRGKIKPATAHQEFRICRTS